MLRLTHPEFDGFAEALQGVQGRYVLRGRQQCDWRLRILDLNGVILMTGRDGTANVYSGACTPGYFTAFIPLRSQSAIVVNGRRFDRATIAWLASDRMFHIGADQPTSWLSVALPVALIDSWLASNERDARSLAKSFCTISETSVASVIQLVHRLFTVDAHAPDGLQGRVTVEMARRDVVDTTLRSIIPTDGLKEAGRPPIDRARILSRALSTLEESGDEPIHTEDLCRAAGVSERTLRNVFRETFGMAPQRYVMLTRLNQARVAIRSARPGETLASICTDLGFWDFGQFARYYRQVFGVLPSQTLAERRRAIGAG